MAEEKYKLVAVSELPEGTSLDNLIVFATDNTNKSVKVPILLLKGNKGDAPFIGTNGNWWVGTTDTGVPSVIAVSQEKGQSTIQAPSLKLFTDTTDKLQTKGINLNVESGAHAISDIISRIWLQHPSLDLSLYDFKLTYVSFRTYYADGLSIQLQYKLKTDTAYTYLDSFNFPMATWSSGVRIVKTSTRPTPLTGIICTLITADNNITSYPNTVVSAIILSGAILNGVTPPDIFAKFTSYDNRFTEYDGKIDAVKLLIPDRQAVVEHSTNYFDYFARTVGYSVRADGSIGTISSNPNNWMTTDFVDLFGATNIIIYRSGGGNYYTLAFYYEDKTYIEGTYQYVFGIGFDGKLTVPSGAVYIRITLSNFTGWQINAGSEPLPYEDYYLNLYYLSDDSVDGVPWKFKPDTKDPDLLALLDDKSINTDVFMPQNIYTVCNDITQSEDNGHNYAVALWIDHLIDISQYARIRFASTQSDKFPLVSKYSSYAPLPSGGRGWLWNEDGSIIKETTKEVQLQGIMDSPIFTFNHVSTLNTATKAEFPIVLTIGDSTVGGFLADKNRPYTQAPRAFWQWSEMFFAFDRYQNGNVAGEYKSLFVGKSNVAIVKGKYDDSTMIDVRACGEGTGGASLAQYLRSATVGSGVTNYFYDSAKTGANKFSVLKYLEQLRTMDDAGQRLTGSAGQTVTGSDGKTYTIGTLVTDTSSFDVATPTHICIQLGYNDGDRTDYITDMQALIAIIKSEFPNMQVCVSLPDCPGTYFPELYPEYGNDDKETYPCSFLLEPAKTYHTRFRY